MGDESDNGQDDELSVKNVQTRFKEGAQAIWTVVTLLVVVVVTFVLRAQGIVSDKTLWVVLGCCIVLGAIILNAGFVVGAVDRGAADRRRQKVMAQLIPDTAATSELCEVSYRERVKQPHSTDSGNEESSH